MDITTQAKLEANVKNLKAERSQKGGHHYPSQAGSKCKEFESREIPKGRTSLPKLGDKCKELRVQRSQKGGHGNRKGRTRDMATEQGRHALGRIEDPNREPFKKKLKAHRSRKDGHHDPRWETHVKNLKAERSQKGGHRYPSWKQM